jgi:holliday junction DNA helicase RuvA
VITRLRGALLTRDTDRVELLTPGGVGYEVSIPLSVFEKLPKVGDEVELRTVQVFREDAVLLFGFLAELERTVFLRLLTASGVGPRLALALISVLGVERLVRAIRERDLATLSSVSGVGKKTAERIGLELSDKLDELPVAPTSAKERGPAVDEAIRALVVLGYATPDAERAVREAAKAAEGAPDAQELIRAALGRMR